MIIEKKVENYNWHNVFKFINLINQPMKAILLLAVIHTLIIYQSQKVQRINKDNFVQQKTYVAEHHLSKFPVIDSKDEVRKDNPGYSSLLTYNMAFGK